MNINTFINDIDIHLNETKRMDCPVCNGKNTFTVSFINGVRVWNCYKASCNTKGNVSVRLNVDDIKQSFKENSRKEDTFVLPEYVVPNGLHHHDVKENRIVFLIKDSEKGVIVDAVGRASGKRLPKWKRYGKSKLPYVAWGESYTQQIKEGKTTCVLVEDCFSAYYVTKLKMTGVALLGTSLLEEHKRFLCHNFDRAIVALDPDALTKNLQIAKELRGWLTDVKVLRLTDDLKYGKETDIHNLKELVWN